MFQSKPGQYFLTTSSRAFQPYKSSTILFQQWLFLIVAVVWVYFFAVKFRTNVRIRSKNFGHLKIFSARFINERFYKFTKSNVTNYCISQKHFQKSILAQYFTTSLKISKAANCFRFSLKSRGNPNHKARARYRSSHNRSEHLGITSRAARIILKHFTSDLVYFSKPQPTKPRP